MTHSTERFIKVKAWENEDDTIRPKQYFYDQRGAIKELIWDSILSTHEECLGIYDTQTRIFYFSCHNCSYRFCYWIKNKERLKKDGVRFIDKDTEISL